MKRTILASILGIAAAMAVSSAHAQGTVSLDTYDGYGGVIKYGSAQLGSVGVGVSNNVSSTWTIGLYYAIGNVTGSVAADPSGIAEPSTLGGGLQLLAAGGGNRTTFGGVAASTPGTFVSAGGLNAIIPGYSSGVVTFEVAAWNGSSWNASGGVGHSGAFTLTPATGPATAPAISTGTAAAPGSLTGMQGFNVYAVPEPSVLALSSIGAAALMLIRRKK